MIKTKYSDGEKLITSKNFFSVVRTYRDSTGVTSSASALATTSLCGELSLLCSQVISVVFVVFKNQCDEECSGV